MIKSSSGILLLTIVLCAPSISLGQTRTVARLFWQDDSTATLRFGDLRKTGSNWALNLQSINGFPKLDTAEQSLGQMQADAGVILLGVRDHDDGTVGSGWVAIDSGAVEEVHGDHSHWPLKNLPRVLHSHVDLAQGNPSHVYKYGKSLVLANDMKNGFTITSASRLRSSQSPTTAVSFYPGGSEHITLAVVENQVAYATWISREGDDSGRVDVVGLGKNQGQTYSFRCPAGGLHGATVNSGKVFLAPADGICWVNADSDVDDSPESISVNHLSIGQDSDGNPLRTGGFADCGQHVLFTSGKGDDAKFCWIDAGSPTPSINSLAIKLSAGDYLTSPIPLNSRTKKLAFIFRENKESPKNDSLLIVNLDPNDDGSFTDAVVAKSIGIGRNQADGHAGHHDAVVLPYGRELAISNPADGTISIVSLSDFSVSITFKVSGAPSRLVAIGG